MKKNIVLLLFVLLGVAGVANAQNEFSFSSSLTNLKAEVDNEVEIELNTTKGVYLFRVDFQLPEGYVLNDDNVSLLRSDGHTMKVSKLESGNYRVFVYSMQEKLLKEKSGTILKIKMNPATSLIGKPFELKIVRAELAFEGKEEVVRTAPVAKSYNVIAPVNNVSTVAKIDAVAGQEILFPIELTNESQVRSMQAVVTLPQGVSIKGDLKFERTSEDMMTDSKVNGQTVAILMLGQPNTAFADSEGAVVTLPLLIDPKQAVGNLSIQISKIELITTNGVSEKKADLATALNVSRYKVEATSSDVKKGTVAGFGTFGQGQEVTLVATALQGFKFEKWMQGDKEVSTAATYAFKASANVSLVAVFSANYLLGDVNEDAVVDVQDAMLIVDFILEKEGSETINKPAADVNKDGTIDVADVLALVEIILNDFEKPEEEVPAQ